MSSTDRGVTSEFAGRHIGPRDADVQKMAEYLGYDNAASVVATSMPESIREAQAPELPAPLTEHEALARLNELAEKNSVRRSFLGLGYYGTITPAVIRRNILENPSWYTAYTPYQPEISQGRLEALVNFQTAVAELAGLELAGSSLLDEGTAVAEAMTVMERATRAKAGAQLVVDSDILPQTLAVLRTRAEARGIEVVVHDTTEGLPEGNVFGVVLQYPGASGQVRDLTDVIAAAKARKIAVTVSADLLALTVLKAPGEMGADIVVGSSQRFGVPMGFGGPHAGFMAVRKGLERSLPGRLVGVSQDANGDAAYRLALQTREQHIRRERATSNICTAQVLLAVMASMYAVYHGPQGLKKIAADVHEKASRVAASLTAHGLHLTTAHFFDTFTVHVPGQASDIVAKAYDAGYLLRQVDADHVAIACDETTTVADLLALVGFFGADLVDAADHGHTDTALVRATTYLTHPVFNTYRSETDMMRYLKRLADKDFGLDRGMIPLGSCTMKLNAATEMESVTWPEFAGLHPFAPAADTAGTRELITELEDWLCAVTGYDAMSLQPNAGSQGEFAGLLAISGYHKSRGDHDRVVCLIPQSAHGTNAASAVMAGMKVVAVGTADNGNIDMDDLRAKVDKHRDQLAAIMITYPSTHGVYEETVTEVCALVHDAGGQVYIDGANMNALVGIARPGKFGSDVSHLNLHKTFCIPHGGGGPGVGPIGVGAHLAPFLPSTDSPLTGDSGHPVGPVASAPYGSAGILQIPWAYLAMMGSEALRRATEVAVVNANYVAKRLSDHYPILYTGNEGLVAHECIVDLRPMKRDTGITVDDVAKRLIDYGFHAPTMSFPVADTLMIEPTESESQAELDRFCDAMIAIKKEADAVAAGTWPADNNPLVNAPHTAAELAGEWDHPYDRSEAVFPAGVNPQSKYWPPVARIDSAYGDRHLMCSCPPLSDLAE